MSARLPSRWLFAAALLAAEGLTSAAPAQSPGCPPGPPVLPAPPTLPAPVPVQLLPGRIYLCGGGSRLPEVQAALGADEFSRHLPFARPPEVSILEPEQIDAVPIKEYLRA